MLALADYRSAYTKTELFGRIKRALKAKVMPDKGPFVNGQPVFYKREKENQWRGPARVIGQDLKIIVVRHGGKVYRSHMIKVRRDHKSSNFDESADENPLVLKTTQPTKFATVPIDDEEAAER